MVVRAAPGRCTEATAQEQAEVAAPQEHATVAASLEEGEAGYLTGGGGLSGRRAARAAVAALPRGLLERRGGSIKKTC